MSTTVRVTNIDPKTKSEDLVILFKSHGCKSRIFPVMSSHSATATFENEGALLKICRLRNEQLSLHGKTLGIDRRFLGFTTLYDGPDPAIDIVALHGLNGHAFDTWRFSKAEADSMWLRDFLHEKVPRARILTYGYRAEVFSSSTGRLRTFAEQLLEDLRTYRNSDATRTRPIIFIGHSMGGLVIKQALMLARTPSNHRFDNILNSVRGIIFMGTPHQGGHGVDAAVIMTNMLRVANVDVKQDLIKGLRADSLDLFDATNDFRKLVEEIRIDVRTLFEGERMRFKWGILGRSILIVDELSATVGCNGEVRYQISADHSNMCKFKGPGDENYMRVSDYILELVGAPEPVTIVLKDTNDSTGGRELNDRINVHSHEMDQDRQQATPFSISSLQGKWFGELIYPSGPPGVSLTVSLEPFIIGRTTNGRGLDNTGEFSAESAQFTYLSTTDYVGIITFLQIYARWPGQAWYFVGTVRKDNNQIFGEWHDSPQDGRGRTGKFNLEGVSRSVRLTAPMTLSSIPPFPSLEGEWSGELVYPSGLPGVSLAVSFEPFIIGRTTNGHGIDNNGKFSIQSAQFTHLSTTNYVGAITFLQIYERWPGQVWCFMGAVHKDNNQISGEWHDSPQDGRGRTGKFSLQRC